MVVSGAVERIFRETESAGEGKSKKGTGRHNFLRTEQSKGSKSAKVAYKGKTSKTGFIWCGKAPIRVKFRNSRICTDVSP